MTGLCPEHKKLLYTGSEITLSKHGHNQHMNGMFIFFSKFELKDVKIFEILFIEIIPQMHESKLTKVPARSIQGVLSEAE